MQSFGGGATQPLRKNRGEGNSAETQPSNHISKPRPLVKDTAPTACHHNGVVWSFHERKVDQN